MNNTTIYALDFDGVICDSAVETAITGWQAAAQLWPDMPKAVPPEMIARFRLVRPIIETGYEAILAMRLLYLGATVEVIYEDYSNQIKILLEEINTTVGALKTLFGTTRDIWIAHDLTSWIEMNPLFDGIALKLQKLGQLCPWYVVTTKQERFVKQILHANGIELADERIFGLDRNMSKVEVLTQLKIWHPEATLVFAEDRLPTLLKVLQTDKLADVKLILALWGYNTDADKALAASQPIISMQLENFIAI